MISKKSVLFTSLFIALIMFLGVVGAQDSCSIVQRADCKESEGKQVVMGLSAETNAHGQFPDKGATGYAYVLCCNIKGVATCGVPKNKIIGLSADTNAHAEIPSLNNYSVNVCYNSLECVSKNNTCSDPNYNIPVLSLSADTNAHIGKFGDYNTKICCKKIAVSGTAYWMNVVGGAIEQADIGDSVGAVFYSPEGGLQGKSIEYTIYKKKAILPDTKITTVTGQPAQLNNAGWFFWIAGKISENEMQTGEYYFKSKVLPNGDEIKSSDLSVTEPEKNALPVANIFSPDYGAWFKTNQLITFSMNGSYDIDDSPSSWRAFWNLDNGKTSNLLRWDFQDSYSQIGQKEIGFMFTTGVGTRQRSALDYTSIMICQGPGIYIFVNISQPINEDEIIIQNNPLVAKAHGTYAWDCKTDSNDCGSNCMVIGECGLLCKDITNDIEKANWTLYQADRAWNYTAWINEENDWKDNMDENIFSVEPERLSDAEYWAIELLIKIKGEMGSAARIFKLYFQGDVCSADGTTWTDTKESTMRNCKRADYENGCCPEGYSCEGSVGNSRCVRSDEWRCGDFTPLGKDECESAEDWIAIKSVKDFFNGEHTCMNGGGGNINIIGYTEDFGFPIWIDGCRCEWENNECIAKYDEHAGHPATDDRPSQIGTCKIREDTNDDCADGFLEIKYIANFEWYSGNSYGSSCPLDNDYILVNNVCRYDPEGKSGLCTSTTNKIPCPEQIKLMFFSFWGIIATLSAIAMIYIWLLFGRVPNERRKNCKIKRR